MKIIRRILSVLFVVTMLIGTGVTADAADNEGTISVNSNDDHTYQVFQIFTGKLTDQSGTQVLSNVKWGKNGKGTEGTEVSETVLNALTTIDENSSDKVKLTEILKHANLEVAAFGEVDKDKSLTVPAGYYLIKDKTHNTSEEDTIYVVKVTGSFAIERKASNTTSDKKLDDINDSDTSADADNARMTTSSDYDIGDNVPYHLTATISDKVGQYSKYHITFEDTLEAGKFDSISALTIKCS